MSRPIQFGIMGCANIARKLSRAIDLSPNATIVAVGSRSEEKARRFIADNGLPATTRSHGSYESLLDDAEVDAVYIPLPTSLRLRWALAAAGKGKHILIEKPTALCLTDLDRILEACEINGVQFMDGTMWVHHPRTAEMEDIIRNSELFGQLKMVSSIANFSGDSDFLQDDIRVKSDLDSLGALGDLGWYCIRSILWASDYNLPKIAIAFPNPVKNEAGVILSCGASLHWEDGTTATFHCSFLAHISFEIVAVGSKGVLSLSDFIIPFEETSAPFIFVSDSGLKELATGWKSLPIKKVISTELPQEALMITEFSRLVGEIKDSGAKRSDAPVWHIGHPWDLYPLSRQNRSSFLCKIRSAFSPSPSSLSPERTSPMIPDCTIGRAETPVFRSSCFWRNFTSSNSILRFSSLPDSLTRSSCLIPLFLKFFAGIASTLPAPAAFVLQLVLGVYDIASALILTVRSRSSLQMKLKWE